MGAFGDGLPGSHVPDMKDLHPAFEFACTWAGAALRRASFMSAFTMMVAMGAPSAGQGAPKTLPPAALPSRDLGSDRLEVRVPAEIWSRDFTRPIEGKLPDGLISALQNVVIGFTGRTPAVSVAVAIPGVGRWAVTQGIARTEPRMPLPPNARFQVASTTKTFTAATVLQLEAEGKLQLSQPIDVWFEDAPSARITTLDHLLRHTSGLVSFNALPSWTLDYREPREAIAMATAKPSQFRPGSNFAYSNTGYAMLGVILEDFEKRPLNEVFRVRISGPLGLKHTTLRIPGDDVPVVSGHLGGKPVEVPDHYATPYAAGGLASTAEDLVTFWHALLGGQLVSPATVRAMFSDLSRMDRSGQTFYGRGVQFYDIASGPGLMVGHSGGITGFTSVVAYVVADDLFVSVLFNEQKAPAEAGLWAVVRAVREARQAGL